MDLNFEILDIKIHNNQTKDNLIALAHKYHLKLAIGEKTDSLRSKLDLTKKVFKEAKKNAQFESALKRLLSENTISDEDSKKFHLLAEFKAILEPFYEEISDKGYENVTTSQSNSSSSSSSQRFKVTTNIITIDHKTPPSSLTKHFYANQSPQFTKRKLDFKTESEQEDLISFTPKTSPKNTNLAQSSKTMAENLPLIRATTFSGSNQEDANEFIDKYNTAARCNKWQEQSKIELLTTHLSGTAYKWLNIYLKANPNTDWNSLENAFLKTFSNVAQVEDLQTILEQRIQLESESSLHFLFEIIHLARRIDPDVEDRKIIDYVIQGIRPEYCNELMKMTNNSLSDLEKNICKLDSWFRQRSKNYQKFTKGNDLSASKHSSNVNSLRTVHFGHQEQNDQAEEELTLQDQLKNIQQTLATLTITHQNKESARQSRGRNSSDRDRSMSPHRRDRTVSPYPNRRNSRDRHASNQRRSRDFSQDRWESSREKSHSPYRSNMRNQQRYRNFSATRNNTQKQSNYNQRQFCYICKLSNHSTDNCNFNVKSRQYSNNRSRQNETSQWCKYCRVSSHSFEQCFKKPNKFRKN